MDLFSNFFSASFQPSLEPAATCLQTHDAIINALPASHANVNAVFVNNNLAVIPGSWKGKAGGQWGPVTTPFYDIVPDEPCVAAALTQIKASDFIVFDDSFFNVIGTSAKLEKIESFPPEFQHVHEAPVYLPETNELLYSDTSVGGFLYAVNIDTHKVRKIHTNPPLQNVNGGTYHRGMVYLAENGGPVRGIHAVNVTSGKTEPILNNYRGRHFNSPNDVIFDSKSNMYFTDPPYGYDQKWPGVQPSELKNGIYRFDPKTKAVYTLSNSAIGYPNGLAFSANEKVLYVADSTSTTQDMQSQRAVFAFDIRPGGLLDSPRLVYHVESGWPDGLRVSKSGLLFVAVSGGVDVVDPKTGTLLGRINCPDDIIFNVESARGRGGVWLLTGMMHIYKATIREAEVEYRVASTVNRLVDQVSSLWN